MINISSIYPLCHKCRMFTPNSTVGHANNARRCHCLNTLRSKQNRRHFPDDIFKCFFLNANILIAITISLKYVPNDPINNIPTLAQKMAWRRPGDKPLSEPMVVRLPTHICVTRPQWVKNILNLTALVAGTVPVFPFSSPPQKGCRQNRLEK